MEPVPRGLGDNLPVFGLLPKGRLTTAGTPSKMGGVPLWNARRRPHSEPPLSASVPLVVRSKALRVPFDRTPNPRLAVPFPSNPEAALVRPGVPSEATRPQSKSPRVSWPHVRGRRRTDRTENAVVRPTAWNPEPTWKPLRNRRQERRPPPTHSEPTPPGSVGTNEAAARNRPVPPYGTGSEGIRRWSFRFRFSTEGEG